MKIGSAHTTATGGRETAREPEAPPLIGGGGDEPPGPPDSWAWMQGPLARRTL